MPRHGVRRWMLVAATAAVLAATVASPARPLRAQGTPIDTDGDGVPDANDCAPTDPRLAEPITYFFDADGDQSGDPTRPVAICAATPFPGTVLWGNDPDDTSATVVAVPAPKGSRVLGIDFAAPAQDGVWHADLARELGADATSLVLQWSALESAPGVFAGAQAAALQGLGTAYAADAFSLNLTVSPFAQTYWTAPADLAAGLQNGTVRLSDPSVIARFNATLDFVHAALGGAPLTSLQIGHEVDLFYGVRSDVRFWSDFITFFQAVRSHARSLWGASLPVGTTSTWTGLVTDPSASLMQQLNSVADIVSVTFVPHTAAYHVVDPTEVRGDVQRVVARYFPKPIAFQSVGYPTAPRTGASVTRQAQFVEAFFSVWDEYASLIPYAAFARLTDESAAAAAADAAAPHLAVPAGASADAAAFLQTLGLRTWDGAGSAKGGYYALRSAALNRGWWRPEPQPTRSFLFGFAPSMYDHVPNAPLETDVLTSTMNTIGQLGDLVSLHFDNGVPWVEAAGDTFGSATPPYSPGVLDTWSKYKALAPAGAQIAVAINPIGVPRHVLAPYWGVGQGFVYDASFNRVGNGISGDTDNRLLPAPWSTYAINSPQVKGAFLNYARRVLDYFKPTYLVTGIEVNLASDAPAFFAQYVELQQYVYTQLKSDPAYANVKILLSFTAEQLQSDEIGVPLLVDGLNDPGLHDRHIAAIRALLPYTDVIGLSVYPVKSRLGTTRIPGNLLDDLFAQIRLVTDKPIAITETGYPAASFTVKNLSFVSDPIKQARFVNLLLDDVGKRDDVEFVTYFSSRDQTAYFDRLRAAATSAPDANTALLEFYKYFEFIGLFDAAGNRRPAADLIAALMAKPLGDPGRLVTPVVVSSPGGALTATVSVGAGGRLQYAVTSGGVPVIEPSPLGITVDGIDLGASVTNVDLTADAPVDETYATTGVHPLAVNHGHAYTLAIRRSGSGDLAFGMTFRLYDDSVAFRYDIPGSGSRTVTGEHDGWTFPEGTDMWYQTNTGNYESSYFHAHVGEVGDLVGPPATFLVPGGPYATVTEARLVDYSGLTLHADLGSRTLRSEFLDDAAWVTQGGSVSPWRVVVIASTLDALVNSDVVANLNDAPDATLFPDGARTAWIKPGRAVWSWWTDRNSPASWDIQKQYVDYATALRAEYVIVDSGWEAGFPTATEDQFQRLKELVDYAHTEQRFVGVWVWKYWPELATADQRHAFFQAVHDAGAVGVKIDDDFALDSESFVNVNRYRDILREAAALHLMIDFHGCNKPTGLSRTYPNEITREAVMGLEANGFWQNGLFAPPDHNATVPFVRLVAGPGDYTPVTFDPRKMGLTTVAHQLATAGLFTSPLQTYADDPATLLAQPAAQDVLRMLPTTWDQTIVLGGSAVGRVAAMARQSHGRWYVFAINGDAAAPTTLTIPLTFLDGRRYDAALIGDATASSFARTTAQVGAGDALSAAMLPGGGFVAVLSAAADLGRPVTQGIGSIPPTFDSSGFARLYTLIRDHADLVSHTFQDAVPWSDALNSTDYRTYSHQLQFYWDLYRGADDTAVPGLARYVMLNPIDPASYQGLAPYWGESPTFTLGAPWNTYAFNDPNVKRAFLNYAIAAVEALHPTHLALDVEANILLAKAPQQWGAFLDLIQSTYIGLKQRYPSLVVFSTIQYEHMLGLTEESRSLALQMRDAYPNVLEREALDVLQYSDLVAISSYPFLVQNNRYMTADGRLDADYFARAYAIAAALGKPIAFEQTGYISRDLFVPSRNVTLPGSPDVQQAFLDRVLHDAHVQNTAFVANFVGIDYGNTYGLFESSQTWAYTGLVNGDDTPKAALTVWDAYRQRPPLTSTASSSRQSALAASSAAPGTSALGGEAAGTLPASTGFSVDPWDLLRQHVAAALAQPADAVAAPAPSIDEARPAPPELVARWQAFDAVTPWYQPGASAAADAVRSALWPWLAPAMADASLRHVPMLRTTAQAFPGDPAAATRTFEFAIGSSLIVAPVVEPGVAARTVYLPAGGDWVEPETGAVFAGGQVVTVAAPLGALTTFVRSTSAAEPDPF